MKKIRRKISNNLAILKNFGIKYAKDDFKDQIVFRKKGKLGKKIFFRKHENVKKYLIKNYGYIIEKYKYENEVNVNIEKNAPIWIFWWQGMDNAPEIVEACFESIKRNAGSHQINLLTKDNYKEYIEFPNYITEKLEKNVITLTHFSDLLRVSLLYEYGGIWLDATIFLNRCFNDEIYSYSFYTAKHDLYKDFHVCKGIWTDSVFMAAPRNVFIKYVKDFFMEYWKNERYLITYFLIDCIIAIGYENIDFIRNELDSIPKNNEDIFEIEKNISMPYDKKIFDINKSDTYIFKTSYKIKLLKRVDNQDTFYNKILNQDI